MHPINILLSISSLTVLAVTVERFSFTTKVLLQPYDFIRLHEVFQILFLISLTVLVPFFLLAEVTNKWEAMKTRKGLFWGGLFIFGVYLYGTGNGIHELASFVFNTYCDTKNITGAICGGQFFNDYYFGNGLYFIGGFLMNLALLIFERENPNKTFTKNSRLLLIINSFIYALAIFAYAAFDRVFVGFAYCVAMTVVIDAFLFLKRKNVWEYPVTVSLGVAYTLGTIASLPVRF